MILACKDINKAYGIDTILESVTFHLEDAEKAAVVGVNGAGKTTLFKIITKNISNDGGQLIMPKDAAIGYLEQNMEISGNSTIYEEMLAVFSDTLKLEARIRDMEHEMSSLSGDALAQHMERYALSVHEFEQKDGYSIKSRIYGVLKGLGFGEDEFQKPVSILSGGQKTRVYLARLLLSQPDLLLLDEPTNHLDIASIQWLEDFLSGYRGAVLLISHDRYFMDRIVTKVIEIENKKSVVYEGNYSHFAAKKEENRAIAMKQYTDQQREIKRQEDVIQKLKSFNREKSIKRAESREKNLAKIERIDRPENLPQKMRLTLDPQVLSGNDVLFAEDLCKAFSGRTLFSGVSFEVKRGEKIAIIGPNGIGKSTLFKILLGQVPAEKGAIRLGANVHLGYYDQEQQALSEEKTIFQELHDTYPHMTNGEIRNVLASFVFTGDDVYKPISALSGGERGRVSLAKIMLSKANLLMLDEPTNHLDMYSKEILEDAINRYTGTVIYISHDRYFINRTAEKVLELTPNGVNLYLGNYSYYLDKKQEKERETLLFGETQSSEKAVPESEAKQDWKKQKEEQAAKRKAARYLEKLESSIEETEAEIKRLDTLLFQEEISCDPGRAREIYEKQETLNQKLAALYDEWGALQ